MVQYLRHVAEWAGLTCLLLAMTGTFVLNAQATEIPPASVKIPAMVAEKSISTFVPSNSAPGRGLAVNIIYPEKPRYKEGAPVVVLVGGADASESLMFSMHASQAGFAEVRFALPGGGTKGFGSSGVYDNQGIKSQEALKDVLLFAAGKLHDFQGHDIGSLLPVKLFNSTVGLVGWSNGGNLGAITLAKYASDLPFVGWIAFYEAPMGALFYPTNLGGIKDLLLNRHYRDGSCATGHCLVDYRKLCWQSDAQKLPGYHRKLGEPEIRGVLFFDENGNGKWEESFEFALWYACDLGLKKQIYPPDVTRAAERLGIFGKKWPDNVATLSESEAYFKERDGSLYIADICRKLPRLMVSVYGNRVDHLQRQADHPHIAMQYNAWLANQVAWVRLNPDPVYIAQCASMNVYNFVDNKINASIDASDMDSCLEAPGLLPDYVYMEAAIAELSDRKKAKKLVDTLSAPLTPYTNGAEPPPAPAKDSQHQAPKGGAAKKEK